MEIRDVKAVSENEVKTSKEWKELLCPKVIIMDPDGWDRSDYDYSFNQEKISKEEFNRRLCTSTCMWNTDHLVPNER